MKNLIIFLFLITTTTLTAQKREIEVDHFDEIYFGLPGTLYLTQGNENKVVVDADPEAWDKIEIEVSRDKLKIKQNNYKRWINLNSSKITVYVTVASIDGISVGGSGDVIGKNIIKTDDLYVNVSGSGSMSLDVRSEALAVKISGSGKVMLEGQADDIDLTISGSGKLKAEDFEVNALDATISGSGSGYITAKQAIEARISGSGCIYYHGNPEKVISNSSGSGKVKRL